MLSGLSGLSGLGICEVAIVPSTLLDNLVAFWKLANLNDEVGGQTLSANGGPRVSTSGKLGSCYGFTASSNQFLSRNSESALQMGNIDFTVAAWAKMDSVSAGRPIVTKWHYEGDNREWLLVYDQPTNKFRFAIDADGASGGSDDIYHPVLPNLNQWYLVIGWHDATNNQIGIQVNDATPVVKSYSLGVKAGAAQFQIGGWTGGSQYMSGWIDGVGLWKRVLSAAERRELWNGGIGAEYPFTKAPVTSMATAYVIADTHVTDAEDPYYNAEYDGTAQLIDFRDNHANPARPETAVLLGDIALDSDAMVEAAGDIIATLINARPVIGNHDKGPDAAYYETPQEDFDARIPLLKSAYGLSDLTYAWEMGDFLCVVLDACYGATDNHTSALKGYIPDAQLTWLAGVLDTDKAGVLVFIHHPPVAAWSGVGEDLFDATDLTALQGALDACTKPVWVFSAHWHSNSMIGHMVGKSPLYIMRSAATSGVYARVQAKTYANGSVGVDVEEVAL